MQPLHARHDKKKTPPKRGFRKGPKTDYLLARVPTTSISTRRFFACAFFGLVVGHRLLLALAFGVDAVLLDALADQISLHGFGTTHRQLLVVGVVADRVGVTDGDDDFEVDATHLADQIVELGAAFRLEHGLVEVEECVGSEGHLLARRRSRRGGGGRRRRRSRRRRRRGRRRRGSRRRRRRRHAIAALHAGARCPSGVTPAQFVGAVLPNRCCPQRASCRPIEQRHRTRKHREQQKRRATPPYSVSS